MTLRIHLISIVFIASLILFQPGVQCFSATLEEKVSIDISLSDSIYLVGQETMAEVRIINLSRDSVLIPSIILPSNYHFIGNNGVNLTSQIIHVTSYGDPITVLKAHDSLIFVDCIRHFFRPALDSVGLSSTTGILIGDNRVHLELGKELRSREHYYVLSRPIGEEATVYSKFRAITRGSGRGHWNDGYLGLVALLGEYPDTRYKIDILREMIRLSTIAKDHEQTISASKRIVGEFPNHFHVDVAFDQLRGLLPAAEFKELLGKLVKEHPMTRAAKKATIELSKLE